NESLQRFHLVSLQMTDEMPAYRHIDIRHLPQCFLNLVLANVVEPRLVSRPRRIRPMRLRYRNDGDLLSTSAACDGCRNSRPHIGYTLSQAGKSHSFQI